MATRFKNLGLSAKDKASSYFVKEDAKLPEDGLVNIQTAHTGLFLNSDAFSATDGSVGLRNDGITDESQFLLVKTSTEGVFGIKSMNSARCLSIATDASSTTRVCLAGDQITPEVRFHDC